MVQNFHIETLNAAAVWDVPDEEAASFVVYGDNCEDFGEFPTRAEAQAFIDERKRGRFRVRKGSLTESLYLQRDGSLGPWASARVFSSQGAADKAGRAAFGNDFGIF